MFSTCLLKVKLIKATKKIWLNKLKKLNKEKIKRKRNPNIVVEAEVEVHLPRQNFLNNPNSKIFHPTYKTSMPKKDLRHLIKASLIFN